MREHVYALGLSAQDVNVKRCTHFAPTLWSEDIQYSLHNYLSRKKHDNKIYKCKKRCYSNGIIVKSYFITFSYIVGLKSKPNFLYSKLFFQINKSQRLCIFNAYS